MKLNQIGKVFFLRKKLDKYPFWKLCNILHALQVFGILLQLHFSSALKDAVLPKDGKIPETKLKTGHFILQKSLPQSEAHHVCETRGKGGGGLVVLPTLKHAQDLSKAIKEVSKPWTSDKDKNQNTYELGMSRRYWIGLVDLVNEGDWVWVKDGSALDYDFWYPGQPDHVKKTNEHCVTLWNPIYYQNETHTFNDEPCVNKHYFICEDPPKRDPKTGQAMRAFMGDITIDDDNSTLPHGVTLHDGDASSPEVVQQGRSAGGSINTNSNTNYDSTENSSPGENDTLPEDGMIKQQGRSMLMSRRLINHNNFTKSDNQTKSPPPAPSAPIPNFEGSRAHPDRNPLPLHMESLQRNKFDEEQDDRYDRAWIYKEPTSNKDSHDPNTELNDLYK